MSRWGVVGSKGGRSCVPLDAVDVMAALVGRVMNGLAMGFSKVRNGNFEGLYLANGLT